MALIQTCQIHAIMTVPQRLSFSAQQSNCNLATLMALGLALGESWPLLAQPQKNTGVQCLPLPVSVGELF